MKVIGLGRVIPGFPIQSIGGRRKNGIIEYANLTGDTIPPDTVWANSTER